MATQINGIAGMKELVGQHLGYSDWLEITQERVNQFAEATGDHQWIHVDVERATAESPFGGPIAHGYLTLALANLFLPQLLSVESFSAGLNIGLDKVRFPSPVPAGSKIRGRSPSGMPRPRSSTSIATPQVASHKGQLR